MDNDSLNRFFKTDSDDNDQFRAYADIRVEVRNLAECLNRLIPESNSKNDILTRLFRIGVDSETAIRMDGVSRVTPMIVMTKQ